MAKGIAHREWALHRSDYETDQDFRAAVEQEQALNVHIQERLGVAIVSAPARRKIGDSWFTEGYIFRTATVPGARDQTPRPAPGSGSSDRSLNPSRPMVGPGGEESLVPESEWESRLYDGWEFDDEFDDADLAEAE